MKFLQQKIVLSLKIETRPEIQKLDRSAPSIHDITVRILQNQQFAYIKII